MGRKGQALMWSDRDGAISTERKAESQKGLFRWATGKHWDRELRGARVPTAALYCRGQLRGVGLQETQILALTTSDLRPLPSFSGPQFPHRIHPGGDFFSCTTLAQAGMEGTGQCPDPSPPTLLLCPLPSVPPRSATPTPPGPYLRRAPRRAGRPPSRAPRWGRQERDGVLGCPGGRGSPASGRPCGPGGRGSPGPRGAVAAAAARAAGAVLGGGAAWCPASGRHSRSQSPAWARRRGGRFKGPAAGIRPAPPGGRERGKHAQGHKESSPRIPAAQAECLGGAGQRRDAQTPPAPALRRGRASAEWARPTPPGPALLLSKPWPVRGRSPPDPPLLLLPLPGLTPGRLWPVPGSQRGGLRSAFPLRPALAASRFHPAPHNTFLSPAK